MDAKEFSVIMKIYIFVSDLVPEFGRDDCWVSVFQSSFALQRWQLGEKLANKPSIS